ncbi:ATP-grasp domain-containing protein [Thermoflexus sp.]|uniref:D-alanine--D-alanine ligase family protein n=1 Tax=Thermoflexus sp. TaxID=1969742 RepID=UPI0035E45AED
MGRRRPVAPNQVLILYSVVKQLPRGEPRDWIAEEEVLVTAQTMASALTGRGWRVVVRAVWDLDSLRETLEAFDPQDTVVVNLCETLEGRPQGEAVVPVALEARGFIYTGSPGPTLALCLDKARAKARIRAAGLPTPPAQVIRDPRERLRIPLPAIVKPLEEDASHGIDRESVAADEAALRKRIAYVLETYRQPALVETFIEGREFNVAIWGGRTLEVLPLAEVDYSRISNPLWRICTFAAKWLPGSEEYELTPVRCPAELEADLEARIRETAIRAFRAVRCRDYGRVDIRLQGETPYVLEVNPNPSLAPNSGFVNAALAAGYTYGTLAERLIRLAWERRSRRKEALQPVQTVGAHVAYSMAASG